MRCAGRAAGLGAWMPHPSPQRQRVSTLILRSWTSVMLQLNMHSWSHGLMGCHRPRCTHASLVLMWDAIRHAPSPARPTHLAVTSVSTHGTRGGPPPAARRRRRRACANDSCTRRDARSDPIDDPTRSVEKKRRKLSFFVKMSMLVVCLRISFVLE